MGPVRGRRSSIRPADRSAAVVNLSTSPKVLQRTNKSIGNVDLLSVLQRRRSHAISGTIITSSLPRKVLARDMETTVAISVGATRRSSLNRGRAIIALERGRSPWWGSRSSISTKQIEWVELGADDGQDQSEDQQDFHVYKMILKNDGAEAETNHLL